MRDLSYWQAKRLGRRKVLAGMSIAGGAALAAACGSGDDKKTTSTTQAPATSGTQASSSAATSAPAAKNLTASKVGGMTDRTGAVANVGKPLGDGVLDFVAYANANNLGGRKVDWIDFDNGYNVDKGTEGYKKFVEQDKVGQVLSFGTPITDAISPRAQDDKIPIWTPGFGVGEQDNGAKFPYTFIGAASYPSQAMALLGHFKEVYKDTSRKAKVYYMYYGNAAGRDPLDLIKAQTPKMNMDLVGTVEVPGTATDLTQQWLEIKSKDPDFVIGHFFGAIPALSLKALQQVGFNPERYYSFVWGAGDGDYAAAGTAAESTYGLQFTALPVDKPEVFVKMQEWHAKNGKTLDPTKLGDQVYYIRGVYNASLMFEAVRLSGDKDKLTGEDIKKGAESMKEFKVGGLAAGVTFSSTDHGGSRKVRLYQFKGGKQNLIKDWFEGPKPA